MFFCGFSVNIFTEKAENSLWDLLNMVVNRSHINICLVRQKKNDKEADPFTSSEDDNVDYMPPP